MASRDGGDRAPRLARLLLAAVSTLSVAACSGFFPAPARQAGYRRVWLVGISMGGLGALATAQQHEDDIEGILLLAPFLGDEEVIDEISARGRLARWTPSPAADGSDDYHRLWRWLKRYTAPGDVRPRLYLGYGTEDRFARADGLLAEALPASHVSRTPGPHAWGPWRELFGAFLASGALTAEKPE